MDKYIIYRIYSKKERVDDERFIYYGWTTSKSILKIFFEQRSPSKYKKFKVEDINSKLSNFTGKYELILKDGARMFLPSDYIDDPDLMLDIICLKSINDPINDFKLIMTKKEAMNTEIKIQEYFHNLSSLEYVEGKGNYVGMFLKLKNYFKNGLNFIGYRPPEVDILFPSADPMDSFNRLEKVKEEIYDAYDAVAEIPDDGSFPTERYQSVPGKLSISDPASLVLYSLESFIKMMREDL